MPLAGAFDLKIFFYCSGIVSITGFVGAAPDLLVERLPLNLKFWKSSNNDA